MLGDVCHCVPHGPAGFMWWTLCVEPSGGFVPVWRAGLMVGITALALLLAVLVGLVLRSRGQAVESLQRQMVRGGKSVVGERWWWGGG